MTGDFLTCPGPLCAFSIALAWRSGDVTISQQLVKREQDDSVWLIKAKSTLRLEPKKLILGFQAMGEPHLNMCFMLLLASCGVNNVHICILNCRFCHGNLYIL